jgi:plastocyanin
MSGSLYVAASGDLFFVVGIVLVAAALLLAFLGIRSHERFPQSRAIVIVGTAIFAAIVVTTMSFAIVKSNQEQKSRNEKLANEEVSGGQQAGASEGSPQPPSPGGQPEASSGGNQQPAQQTTAQTLKVSSPADGGLVYQPDGLTAQPGNVTIDYTNPSPVPHSIAVATANGNVISQVQPFTNGSQSVALNGLKPGKYIFFCTVPGHREAGMEGDLTVTGGPTP